MPGVEVIRVSVPGDVEGDVDIVPLPRTLTNMVIVCLESQPKQLHELH